MDIHIHIERVIVHDEAAIIAAIQHAEERIMGALDALQAQLDQANEQTNQIAANLAALGPTITEIATDIDNLLAIIAAGTPGSQEVADATAKATALTAQLTTAASQLTDTATTLQGVAAKS
jgi:uncharacterized phage infection (PIP) family protein YhgE